MDQIANRLTTLKKAMVSLKKIIDTFNFNASALPNEKEDPEIYGLALVKQFEITYEFAWKCCEKFLQDTHGIEEPTPKGTFRKLKQLGLIDQDETETLMYMADSRNQTIHLYDQQDALIICPQIESYYRAIEKLIQVIEPAI